MCGEKNTLQTINITKKTVFIAETDYDFYGKLFLPMAMMLFHQQAHAHLLQQVFVGN